MLLGHGAIGQFGVAEALSGLVVNAGTVELTLGQSVGTSTGSETVTGSASFAVTTAGAPSFSLGTEVATGGANVTIEGTDLGATFSVGDEDAFGTNFQNLITFSAGSLDFFIWSAADDSETSTWKNVEPGSTD